MRILVISDIHANLTALEAVMAEAGKFDAAWCLGDLVGYGPDPNECVALIRELPGLLCIIGNHDLAALQQLNSDTFNPEARLAILWTQHALSESSRNFLQSLPEKIEYEDVTLSHGSPRHPGLGVPAGYAHCNAQFQFLRYAAVLCRSYPSAGHLYLRR